ncbi:glycerophosphoinositol inositolphosphodiesterase GDPD2 [Varanus komodoensis]|uniref:glycerophosphoinositol inositolphosphodiesterase GDPD2 n=1 Tax=Varanus komodoensis TaxID=61221 RepID=UPI001CF79665|nr:glycerophosphoinositol inositolphosphodiesterase GDPD2 [Varanus komodoensis]
MAKDGGCSGLCATCLLCLYSCRWRRSGKGLSTSKCDCAWFFFLLGVCLFTLAWLYLALITLNDFHNLNEFIFRKTEWWLDWSLVMLSGTATLATYASVLLVLALGLQLCRQPLKLHWLHKSLLILAVLAVAAAFVGVEIQWASQWESAHISLQATGPFLHIGAVVGMTLLAWPVADCFYRTSRSALRIPLLLLYLGSVFALYLAPLGIDSPCFLEHSQLPPKPALFGHRGAPMLAPENTLMSFQKAANCGVSAWETDVLVSADGVPFIMHDETLIRTTNAEEVFPVLARSSASAFNWTQLQQLDAGSWFVQNPPFPTARSLSRDDLILAKAQRILSLTQLLGEAERHNMAVMFDLRPEEDPQYQHLVNITVAAVLQSGISPELILWLPEQFRDQVKKQAPGFRHVYKRKRLSNETEAPLRVNLPYQNLSTAEIREYRQDNISVNLYVVNAPWLFSVLWCAGASSVTTNTCHVLQGMERPLWLLPRATYQMIWIVTDCVSFLLIAWAFLLLKRWSRRKEPAGSDSDVLLTKIHSLLAE